MQPSTSATVQASQFAIKRWMTPTPHSIGKEQSLSVAHQVMKRHALRHLPVLERGKLVGMLSERDLLFLETITDVDPEKETVEQGMTQDVYCVSPEAQVEVVAREMVTHRYGCAVVVEDSKIVGIFTTIDALSLLIRVLSGDGPSAPR
jgi:acetoin utilization protein AcuB